MPEFCGGFRVETKSPPRCGWWVRPLVPIQLRDRLSKTGVYWFPSKPTLKKTGSKNVMYSEI